MNCPSTSQTVTYFSGESSSVDQKTACCVSDRYLAWWQGLDQPLQGTKTIYSVTYVTDCFPTPSCLKILRPER